MCNLHFLAHNQEIKFKKFLGIPGEEMIGSVSLFLL